jgi:pimeloyl-ACP methyl ester carboxylesterase
MTPGELDAWPVHVVEAELAAAEAGGIRIAYLEAGPADGPLVLCLHGFPDSPHTFRFLAGELVATGRRVVVPWLRGYPPSEVVTGPYQVAALARDAVALARALSPGRPVELIGHDWGALAAYGAGVLAPDLFVRLVTLSVPPTRVYRPFLRINWDQQRASWYQFLFQLEELSDAVVPADGFAYLERLWRSWSPGWEPDPISLGAAIASIREGWPAALSFYRDTWQRRRQDPSLAKDQAAIVDGPLTVPALVLHGRQDGCILPGAFAAADAYFAAAHRIEAVAGVGHFLHLEDPVRVNTEILGFLDRPAAVPARG